MEQDHKEEMEEIIGQFECPKDFRCCNPGIGALCRARDIGLESFLLCLEEDPKGCPFSRSFGSSYLCQCTLRIYMAKKLHK